MRKSVAVAVVAVIAVAFIILCATPIAAAKEPAKKAKWSCSKGPKCTWKKCEVVVLGDGKLSLSVTGPANEENVIHLLRVENGTITSQRWIDAETSKTTDNNLDIFRRDCVGDGQLKSLPPEIQQQFLGVYDIPAPVVAKTEGITTPPGP